MVDIPDIQVELVFPGQHVTAIDLRPPGYARQNFMAARLLRCVALQVLHQQWARTDQAHLTPQYIKQLRKFVQAGSPQESAPAGQALFIWAQTTLDIAGLGHLTALITLKE